jgi:hypothetical protein
MNKSKMNVARLGLARGRVDANSLVAPAKTLHRTPFNASGSFGTIPAQITLFRLALGLVLAFDKIDAGRLKFARTHT